MSKFFSVVLLCLYACTHTGNNLEEIRQHFQRPEYIPTKGLGADGWAYARRRRILERYFKKIHLEYKIKEKDIPLKADKYRNPILFLKGTGTQEIQLTLALFVTEKGIPSAMFQRLQAECDKHLFGLLSDFIAHPSKWSKVELSQTKSCNHLTAHTTTQK